MSGEINTRIREIVTKADPLKMAKIAYDHLQKITPIDKGNARKQTKLDRDVVHADYAYAQRLDQNWSPQTKNKGLIQPTLEEVQKNIDNI
jgi:hypothetical protein